MSKGFHDLRNETLRLLNESADSVIAELPSGTGSAPTLTNDNGILQYLNEAAFDLCRTCVYLPATLSVASHTGRTYDFSASLLTSPITIHINGTTVPLTRCGENELRSYDLNYTITSGEPTYWYEAGYNNIGFYSVPSTAIAFIVRGAGLPTKLTSSSAAVTIGTATITGTNSFVANQEIVFDTSTVTNIVAGVTYYVSATALTTSAFQISATSGGSSITPTGGTGGTFIVYGGNYSFISDDLLMQALPSYAARKIALKNYDDPSIVGRTFWGDWYDQVRMQLWAKLDPSYKMANGIFSVPPVMSAGGK
jgi:hypothetical protein